jgi:hypothetical protein
MYVKHADLVKNAIQEKKNVAQKIDAQDTAINTSYVLPSS